MSNLKPNTSNYGRALFHLNEAEQEDIWGGMQQAIMANARATLALVEATRGDVDPYPIFDVRDLDSD